jgi:hypothetical protein
MKKAYLTIALSLVIPFTLALSAQIGAPPSNGGIAMLGGSGSGGASLTTANTWTQPQTFPSIKFTGGTTLTGLSTNSFAQFINSGGTAFSRLYFGPQTTNGLVFTTFPAQINILDGALGDTAQLNINKHFVTGGILFNQNSFATQETLSASLPTITSGFGTSPSLTGISGSVAFKLTIGTGGIATTGVLGLTPTAQNGWACDVNDQTTINATKQSANTTASVTISTSVAWTAGDVLLIKCASF